MRINPFANKLSAPVKASIAFAFCSIIQKGIALLSTPIFTRIMTTEQYGAYTVFQSWYSILTIFATLNLSAGVYNNGLTKWPEEKHVFTAALQGLSTTITLVLLLAYAVNVGFWNKLFTLSTTMMIAMFAQLFVVPAFSFWSTGQRYNYKYKALVIVSISMAFASPLLGIISVLHTNNKSEAIVLSYALVQVLIGVFFYIKTFKDGRSFYNKKYWSFALGFNLPLIPHYLSRSVLNQADRIMINNMVGASQAAMYGVAHNFALMFTIITNAVNMSYIPYTYQSMKAKNYKTLRSTSTSLVFIVACACIIAMLVGPEFVRVFAAEEYYEARWVMLPIAESLLFMFIYPLFCNIEFYFEKTKFIMVASSSAALANIALNYVMMRQWGYIAAAYSTLICYILLSIAHYIAYRRLIKEKGIEKEIYNIGPIVLISIVSLVVMGLLVPIYDNTVIRYTLLFAIIIVVIFKRKFIMDVFLSIKNKNSGIESQQEDF